MKKVVIPTYRKDAALAATRCVYSVSLSTDEFRYRRTLNGLLWAISEFEEVTVFLGDGMLLRTTLLITGVHQEDIDAQTKEIASEVVKDISEISSKVQIWKASTALLDSDFRQKHQLLKEAFGTDDALRKSVQHDAKEYIERLTSSGKLKIPLSEACELAEQYLLFEIASYAFLSDKGLSVDVYAGGSSELPTLEKFINNQITGFPELTNRSCIILKS